MHVKTPQRFLTSTSPLNKKIVAGTLLLKIALKKRRLIEKKKKVPKKKKKNNKGRVGRLEYGFFCSIVRSKIKKNDKLYYHSYSRHVAALCVWCYSLSGVTQ